MNGFLISCAISFLITFYAVAPLSANGDETIGGSARPGDISFEDKDEERTPVWCAGSLCGEQALEFGGQGGGGSERFVVWESVPSVVRAVGEDSFSLQVTIHDAASGVQLDLFPGVLEESGDRLLWLRDDGLGSDRTAGDRVHTSTRLFVDPEYPMARQFRNDPASPAGLSFMTLGTVVIWHGDGTSNQFLVPPAVGLLDERIPLRPRRRLGAGIEASHHLVNIRTGMRATQRQLRFMAMGLPEVTRRFYGVLPDDFDFLMFFSVDHLEFLPRTWLYNFNAGVHMSVRVDFTGTGERRFNQSAAYGSEGRLQGVNVLDVLERGLYSQNAVHEISHQWGVSANADLGISDGTGHYRARSSAASLLGGVRFAPGSSPGSYWIDCQEGRAGARHAPPLDLYWMGLVGPDAVPPLMFYSENQPAPFIICGQPVGEIERTLTISEVQSVLGPRLPGPETAQRDFKLAWVIESYDRVLTDAEMTYYDILAEHFGHGPVDIENPPVQGFNWVPVRSYFGHDTTWTTRIDAVSKPRVEGVAGGAGRRVRGTGFPYESYTIESSGDLVLWREAGHVTTGSDGRWEFQEQNEADARFYRVTRR